MRDCKEPTGRVKGCKINSNGYELTYLNPDNPFYSMSGITGYALTHRIIMAQYLGRMLLSREQVHHINGDRLDNRIENLNLTTPENHPTGYREGYLAGLQAAKRN